MLLSRNNEYNQDDTFQMVNVTPAGTSIYPTNLTNGNNRIHRRTYIDFSNPDPRWHGMYDWKKYRLVGAPGQNGVTEDWVRVDDGGRADMERLDTKVAVLQSRWWENRIVTTVGFRNDRRRSYRDENYVESPVTGELIAVSTAQRDPTTQAWLTRTRGNALDYGEGDTRTLGVVAHPLKWLALFYNTSNSFEPQSHLKDIFGGPLVNRDGKGLDASPNDRRHVIEPLTDQITPPRIFDHRSPEMDATTHAGSASSRASPLGAAPRERWFGCATGGEE